MTSLIVLKSVLDLLFNVFVVSSVLQEQLIETCLVSLTELVSISTHGVPLLTSCICLNRARNILRFFD